MDAREAVNVLLDPAVVKLVAAVVVGWWLLDASAAGWVGFPAPLQLVYDGLVALARFAGVVYYGGALALLVELVYEASRRANAR